MIEIGLVGPGRLGRALAALLPREKFRLGAVMSSTFTSARRAVREMEIGHPTDDPEAFATCDVILIAVRDNVLDMVVEQFSLAQFPFARKAVLHTSRVRVSSDLKPLAERGAAVGSLLPLYIFPRPVFELAGVHCAVEGDTSAARMARRMIRAWDAVFLRVEPEHKIHLAMACSMASDLFAGLLESAVRQTMVSGIPRKRAFAAMSALFEATLKEYSHSGRRCRPGPLLQGDAAVIGAYLEAVRPADPQAAARYQHAARQTLELFRKFNADFSFLSDHDAIPARAFATGAGRGSD